MLLCGKNKFSQGLGKLCREKSPPLLYAALSAYFHCHYRRFFTPRYSWSNHCRKFLILTRILAVSHHVPAWQNSLRDQSNVYFGEDVKNLIGLLPISSSKWQRKIGVCLSNICHQIIKYFARRIAFSPYKLRQVTWISNKIYAFPHYAVKNVHWRAKNVSPTSLVSRLHLVCEQINWHSIMAETVIDAVASLDIIFF